MLKKKYDITDEIPSGEFTFAHQDESIHDTKFETKPVSWLKDSIRRFAKNKASVVGFFIIIFIALFAIIVPIASPDYESCSSQDLVVFSTVLPRSHMGKNGFWDGTKKETLQESTYIWSKYDESNYDKYELLEIIGKDEIKIGDQVIVEASHEYVCRVNTYSVGIKEVKVSAEFLNSLQNYEIENAISMSEDPVGNAKKSIIKPIVDISSYVAPGGEFDMWLQAQPEWTNGSDTSNMLDKLNTYYNQHQSVYYKIIPLKRDGKYIDTAFQPLLDSNENIQPLYAKDINGNFRYVKEDGIQTEYTIRVDFFDYFNYKYGFKPIFVFGTNESGQDIFTRLAKGARFSLLLGVGISLINFIIGLIWGAVSGYYGGKADLIMERFTDIIANVPTIIIMTIAQIQLTNNMELRAKVGPAGTIILAILIAFVYNGWVGVASTTRMQFYRFKGQEYVLASRTLGAKDRRLIFKHILPNAAGTLVTSCVLMIPGVIFSESSLSYLGIINFQTSGICSVGALLDEGQRAGIKDYPHVLLFPALLISLLMISFNMFGNGLRDAFNTTLRGSED